MSYQTVANGQKFKNILSLSKAPKNLWCIYAPVAVKLLTKASSAKQILHVAKSHRLSQQFKQIELSGFNTEQKWNDLASGELNH